MPARCNLFGSCKNDRLVLIGSAIKNTTKASDDYHEEESASEVTPECDNPMDESLFNTQFTLQDGHSGVLVLFSLVSRREGSALTMKLPVQRSAPDKTTVHQP